MVWKYLHLLRWKHVIIVGLLIGIPITVDTLSTFSSGKNEESGTQVEKQTKKEENKVLGATIAPTTTAKQQVGSAKKMTPTPGKQSQNNPPNNNSSGNTSTNTTIQIVLTATPMPIPTATPTPENTPTPTPDNTPFEASWNLQGQTAVITANKPIKQCQFVSFTTSGMDIVVSGDGSISGNTCTISFGNTNHSYGARVKSFNDEASIFGDSPPNYW